MTDGLDVTGPVDPQREVFARERSRGASVARAATAAGVSRSTGTRWEADPEVRAHVARLIEARYADPTAWLDDLVPVAVEKLGAAVRAGEEWAIRDVLDRRYGKAVARTEVTGKDGGPVEVVRRDDLVARVLVLAASAEPTGT